MVKAPYIILQQLKKVDTWVITKKIQNNPMLSKCRYGDARDKGHSILYQYEKVDAAHWNENRIKIALRTLREHLFALKESYEAEKN